MAAFDAEAAASPALVFAVEELLEADVAEEAAAVSLELAEDADEALCDALFAL